MIRSMIAVTIPLSLMACGGSGGGKKPTESAVQLVGWAKTEDMSGECYYPKNFDSLGIGDRRIARMEAMNAMIEHWRGDRGDISFGGKLAENVETVLLGTPELAEEVSRKNAELCTKAMKGGGTGAWEAWVTELPNELTKGMCKGNLPGALFDYLALDAGWHIPAPVCAGDKVQVEASETDYYQVVKDGPWINADGDPDAEVDSSLPCTLEGCTAGMVVLKFVSYDNIETVYPMGTGMLFTAPAHGTIYVTLNDIEYNDNEWKVESGIQHHTQVSYTPK